MSFEQVKQWAKIAVAFGGPAGRSSLAAKPCPCEPEKTIFSDVAGMIRLLGSRCRKVHCSARRKHHGCGHTGKSYLWHCRLKGDLRSAGRHKK